MAQPSFTFASPLQTGPTQWHYGFSRFAEVLSDWRPVFQAIVDDWIKSETAQFSTQGAYGFGKQWQPLSDAYAKWKDEHAPGKPLLVLTGSMRNAVLHPTVEMTKTRLVIRVDHNPAGAAIRGKLGGVVASPDTPDRGLLAGWHETGAGRLPARPILAMPQSQVTRWQKTFQSYMVAVTRGEQWTLR